MTPLDALPSHFPTLIAAARGLRRAVLVRRRLLAAACAAVAVAAGVRALAPPPTPSVAVPVAAHDLPAGATLGADDVTTARLPRDALPDGLSTALADSPVGRRVTGPLTAGEPLTESRLLGPALVTEPGLSAVPVRLPDAGLADLLRVGDRIDLLATDPQGGRSSLIASDVGVVALPRGESSSSAAMQGRVVVLALPVAQISDVTDAAVRLFLTYAWAR